MTAPTFEDVLKQINLGEPHADMFDTHAKIIADTLAAGDANRTAQIRRFYDELLRYELSTRPSAEPEAFQKQLPFIRMLNARAAYAQERKLVTANFTRFLRTLLQQVQDQKGLGHACTMFEAVIGFSPKPGAKS